MDRRKLALRIWLPALGLIVALLAGVAGPLRTGWRCYELHAHGERAETRVVEKTAAGGLVLQITSGPGTGRHCTASTGEGHFARLRPGDALEVVLPQERPGECVLVSTLENSAALLLATGGAVAALVLLVVLLASFLQRTLSQPGVPSTRFDLPGGGLACPRCQAPMSEGYLPLLAGIHWRAPGEPVGLPHALSGLPGTTGWRGRPRLHAYRCAKCAIVTFQHARG